MKKLIVAVIMMMAFLSGCNDKVYYEYCDEWGNCVWSEVPPNNPQPSPVVYVVEEAPTNTSHSHSEETYVYYDDSHNHTEVIIIEDNGYDPYYYEFHNNFQEFCYGEGTPYHTTTCWQEWCFDHWLGGGWYVWDEWCE